MNHAWGLAAVALVAIATLGMGSWGFTISRKTSDFFVASRAVRPSLNASAIGGEYLSAASFLGIAGLVLTNGAEMLWYPIGWTAGYLVLLVLVAAPLRRSGAYTLPDFAQARWGSLRLRKATSAMVVAIGVLYLFPLFSGAGLTLRWATGLDPWVGSLVVAIVVLANVLPGGMRSVTFAQAFQFWLKLAALAVPALVLLMVWRSDGAISPTTAAGADWADPVADTASDAQGLYTTYSIIAATFLGTMGLPHVVVRFYTNPDGRAARRTTLAVLALLGCFYVVPPVYGALGRLYAADLIATGRADLVVLELPSRMLPGMGGQVLTALLVAGAFAAFLSTCSGLTVAVAGVVSQDLFSRFATRIQAFRLAAIVAVLVPYLLGTLSHDIGVAAAIGLAFAVTASTFCPLLVLGIWWPRLTEHGALAGLLVGGSTSALAALRSLVSTDAGSWWGTVMAQPALWSVPLSFATMIAVSWLTPVRHPAQVTRFMTRLHSPESTRSDIPGN